MTTHYYTHTGCLGGCLLALITACLWPLWLVIRLFGGKPVTFGGDLRDPFTPAPDDRGAGRDGAIDVEAKEVPPETIDRK